jgi:DNA-directed RNA polymerase I and III subunit RPAC2
MEDVPDEYPLIPPTRADTLKVQVIPGHTSTSATFLIANEDHTLGNALRYVLMRDAHTAMCGYSLPHPSEELVNLRLQTRALEGEAPEGADVVRVFRKGLRDLQDMAKIMEDALDAAGEGGGEEAEAGGGEGGGGGGGGGSAPQQRRASGGGAAAAAAAAAGGEGGPAAAPGSGRRKR